MKFLRTLLILLLIPFLALPVFALQPKVVDEADLLSREEESMLEAKAQALAEQYSMDVVILTVNSTSGVYIEQYADDYYDNNGYGIGENYSGVLVMLCMDTREWAISTCGDTRYALTDYGIEQLFSVMAGDLSYGYYYDAFDAYLNALPQYFDAYLKGDPIDGDSGGYTGPGSYEPGTDDDIIYYPEDPPGFWDVFPTSLLIGAVVALITVLIMRSSMNTVRKQSSASAYKAYEGCRLVRQQDIFLYSTLSRTRRPQDTGGGGGGGGSSVHRSSSGRSHGGGHGRF